jgi:hypothetical protein
MAGWRFGGRIRPLLQDLLSCSGLPISFVSVTLAIASVSQTVLFTFEVGDGVISM